MFTTLLTTALLTTLPASDPPASDAAKKDLEQMQGKWVMQALEVNGEKATEEQLKASHKTVTGNKYTVNYEAEEGPKTLTATLILDASKSPKTLDAVVEGEGEMKGVRLLAIYKLEGATHTICVGRRGQPRPTAFDSKQGTLTVWKRAADK